MENIINWMNLHATSTFIVILIVFTASFTVLLWKLFSNSHIFKISFLFMSIAILFSLMSFYIGKEGLQHVLWGAPIAVASLASLLTYWNRAIRNPLEEVTQNILRIARGDLTVRTKLRKTGNDEISRLIEGQLIMVEKLSEINRNIQEVVGAVSSDTDKLEHSSSSLSSDAQEQAATSEELSGSMEELNANIDQNKALTYQTNQIAEGIQSDLVSGSKMIFDTFELNTTIQRNSNRAEMVGSSVSNLEHQIEKLKKVTNYFILTHDATMKKMPVSPNETVPFQVLSAS